MEARLGEDFSGVRVHFGAEAAESAKAHGARAYAVGEDVVFGAGELRPETPRGARLLEHELGHVVEQRHGAPLAVNRAPEGEGETTESLRVPHLKLDPGIGSLSLGLSTLDDFAFNKSELKPTHLAAIADVAQKLTMLQVRMPAGRVTVTGHTDLVGGEDVNIGLGRARAQAVQQALMKEGVPEGSIHVATEGKHEPIVATKRAEPRNRRVEVRFQGELVTPDVGAGLPGRLELGADRPTRIDLTPPVSLGTQPLVPPFLQPQKLPLQRPVVPPVQSQTPRLAERDQPPRPGTAGDILEALSKTDPLKGLIEQAKEKGAADWKALPPAEKAVVVGSGVSIGVLAGVGISSDPAARKAALDALDGAEIRVPGVPWLKLKAHTKAGGLGGGIQVDVIRLVGGGKR
jgi:outer membrane protein OmpA-like peptidoglycan-associated protein